MTTRLVSDPAYLDHVAGPMHPESLERLAAIHALLERAPVQGLERVAPRAAARDELLTVHDAA